MSAIARDSELGGRYRLTSRIAVGGMGEVWRAEDTLLHRKVAVKVLKSELMSDPTFLERFRAEARNTAALSHPGVASVHDYGEVDEDGQRTAYLIMELVDGEPLSAILARIRRLPTDRVLDVVEQAAAALDAAHRTGTVHRDVKPGNLLVTGSGSVKITDFGIARVAESVPLTQAGMVVGTAQYFAPEQAEGRVTTPASDVYSLGVVAYECLAGRLPFIADSSVAVAVMQIRDAAPPLPADVPPLVRALVARAMAKDPANRFANGGQFAKAIAAVRRGVPFEPVPAPAPPAYPAATAVTAPAAPPAHAVSTGTGIQPRTPPTSPPPTSTGTRIPPPLPPPRRRVPAWLWVVASVILVGALTSLALVLNSGPDASEGGDPNEGVPSQHSEEPSQLPSDGNSGGKERIPIHVERYLDRPYDMVAEELMTLGLEPTRVFLDPGLPRALPGFVVGFDGPDGFMTAGEFEARAGSEVVVYVMPERPVSGDK